MLLLLLEKIDNYQVQLEIKDVLFKFPVQFKDAV